MKVIKVSERNKSKLCRRCGWRRIRTGSLFKCPYCTECNRTMNIMKRPMGYMRMAGGRVDTASNPVG
ncbi:MAG: hypothetical protein FGF48_04840 [Candidatus Brockarchaeota archaeon]|nr:hypothetical protein [Candidatus Brockarchaeota archaeon]